MSAQALTRGCERSGEGGGEDTGAVGLVADREPCCSDADGTVTRLRPFACDVSQGTELAPMERDDDALCCSCVLNSLGAAAVVVYQ